MDRSSELGSAAAHTACPYCAHQGLAYALRCDLGFGACIFTASCDRCGASLEIVIGEDDLDPKEVARTAGPCPGCGDARRVATLTCSDKTQACVYHLECPACGDQSSTPEGSLGR